MPRTVLIVDDIETNRLILRKILGDEYAVLEAENGKEALEIIKRNYRSLSAILLDIIMPVMDGYEVLEQMQNNATISQIPVIVTTGSTDENAEIKALTLGANDFVTKPYNPEAIKCRLKNTINLRETAASLNAIYWDDLTGLYNRNAFLDKAASMISAHPAGHYVMCCFDINNFKVINDQYGSNKGDEVLKMIADIFLEYSEKMFSICCRIVADKYAVLFPCSYLESEEIAQIKYKVSMLDGSIAPISFSIGLYIIEDKSLSVSSMYDRASIALNSVKGRFDSHIAFYRESMRAHILREQEIFNEMKTALKNGHFEPWFQPQYNHSTGALIGAEALARWRHAQKGVIPPKEFIAVFERNGFIYEMDKYIWEQCCILLRKWIDEGRSPLPVSVNVSRYDVFRDDMVDVILGLVQKYRIPVDLLRLEITESAFAESTDQIIHVVKQLIACGFTVEIDDFGSGYSSLNTLKDVPATILKLDMKFLENNSGDSQRGGNILESVVRMAKWLGMSVIAEGVETREQADYLLSIGCPYMQGYLYASPMPVEQYEELAKDAVKERKMRSLETVEKLDNNAFWDPASMDTLIFNSYVGAACIFEYRNGKSEILRVNHKYVRELGGMGMTMEEVMVIDPVDYMDEDDISAIYHSIRQAIETEAESTCDICLHGLPGEHEPIYIRVSVREIARAGQQRLFYCSISNTTAQRKAEQMERRVTDQLRFLNETARDLLAQKDTANGINDVLLRVRDYFDGARAYVIEIDYINEVLNKTYEVCASGVSSETHNLQDIPFHAYPLSFKAFKETGFVSIEDVDALDESRAAHKEFLKQQGIGSLIEVPLLQDDRLVGIVGVNDPQRHQSHTAHLQAIGHYLSVMLARRDQNAKIDSHTKTIIGLMNDTPGGFVRMQAFPDGAIIPVCVNEGFCGLVGMTHDEVMEKYGESALWGVHPDDVEVVADLVEEMMATGEACSTTCRLRTGNGGYIQLTVSGRMTKSNTGEIFLNVYYSVPSEQEKDQLCDRETQPSATDVRPS
ncbi:MAG: EAL domain-containing protein [Syntrophomonadaceae bacterium]|nr:EAL domain-containing protein [Syntrophomonadaceae bacterium]